MLQAIWAPFILFAVALCCWYFPFLFFLLAPFASAFSLYIFCRRSWGQAIWFSLLTIVVVLVLLPADWLRLGAFVVLLMIMPLVPWYALSVKFDPRLFVIFSFALFCLVNLAWGKDFIFINDFVKNFWPTLTVAVSLLQMFAFYFASKYVLLATGKVPSSLPSFEEWRLPKMFLPAFFLSVGLVVFFPSIFTFNLLGVLIVIGYLFGLSAFYYFLLKWELPKKWIVVILIIGGMNPLIVLPFFVFSMVEPWVGVRL